MKKIYNTAEMDIVALHHGNIILTSPNLDRPESLSSFGGFRGDYDENSQIIGYGED